MAPKGHLRSFFFNFKRKFHIRAETAIMQQLNINLFYNLFDLNGVLSSHVTRWRCRIISCYENHVINLVLFTCEIVVFPILRPFLIKNSFFRVTWLRDGVLYYPPGHPSYILYIILCLQERDFGSKKKISFTPSRFRIFWVASPIFGTASTIEQKNSEVCHLVKTKL